METVVMCFLILASVVVLFSILLVALETVREMRARNSQSPNTKEAKTSKQKDEEQPSETSMPSESIRDEVIQKATEEACATDEQTEQPDRLNGVWISATQKQTLEEKYLALQPEQRGWYEEIKYHAMSKTGIKHYKNDRYEDFKIGIQRIVRISIKREVIQCEFVLINQDFRNYVNDNKVAIKAAPIIIKIENSEAVDAAKNSIDIAVSAVEAERQYKKERRKAGRRKALAENLNE